MKHQASPPSRRRGLKCQSDGVVTNYHSRLLRGGVDWNFVRLKRPHKKKRRLLRGGVDWNWSRVGLMLLCDSRLLRGGVDWNLNLPLPVSCLWLSPPSRRRGLKYYGVIWKERKYESPPSRRRGLKFSVVASGAVLGWSPPSRRRGLKLVIRTTVLVVVTSSLRRDNNYNSLQNNKYIDEKFYKHFMMAVLFDCFAFVY